jgi:hypothetical protein
MITGGGDVLPKIRPRFGDNTVADPASFDTGPAGGILKRMRLNAVGDEPLPTQQKPKQKAKQNERRNVVLPSKLATNKAASKKKAQEAAKEMQESPGDKDTRLTFLFHYLRYMTWKDAEEKVKGDKGTQNLMKEIATANVKKADKSIVKLQVKSLGKDLVHATTFIRNPGKWGKASARSGNHWGLFHLTSEYPTFIFSFFLV